MQKVVLITSVIEFKNKPLSYSGVRSVFTSEERLKQTKMSIQSVKNKIPNAIIILCELGCDQELALSLKPLVDIYYYFGGKHLVRCSVDSRFKGLGEAIGLLYTVKYIKNLKFDVFLKLSGRYYLNDNFKDSKWGSCEGFLAKKYSRTISTRLYGFPKKEFKNWVMSLLFSLPMLCLNVSIERTLFLFLNKKIKNIETLGVSGEIATDNSLIVE